jgi:5'-3' exonuclease
MSQLFSYIFIDGSYFCFYRYFALLTWWKNAFPEDPILGDPADNPFFVDKFKKMCIQSLETIPKKIGISKEDIKQNKYKIFIGKDCKREDIWRLEFYKEYKSTRLHNPYISSFFKILYNEDDGIFTRVESNYTILEHPHLEADDSIALSILANKTCESIYIITSDNDYMQLLNESRNIQIWNLAGKQISLDKNGPKELFCKIVMGDVSDNISAILKKCGPKTALKCFQNSTYFEERLKKENALEKRKLNQLLIDFNNIPEYLQKEYLNKFKVL